MKLSYATTATLAVVALASTGCTIDRQTFTRRPDGSYTARVSLLTFGVSASVAGMRSEWTADPSGMIYGDSVTNLQVRADADLVKAISAGVVEGLVKAGMMP